MQKSVRDTFRFKLLFGVILSAIFAVIFLTVGEPLIQQFIHQGGIERSGGDAGRLTEVIVIEFYLCVDTSAAVRARCVKPGNGHSDDQRHHRGMRQSGV